MGAFDYAYVMEKRRNKSNPRYKNGSLRRKYRERFKAMDAPCAICGKPIRYDEPSDAKHPLSFVIDEAFPISRYKEFGYRSPAQAAQDWNNLQACHYACNQMKGRCTMNEIMRKRKVIGASAFVSDGEW